MWNAFAVKYVIFVVIVLLTFFVLRFVQRFQIRFLSETSIILLWGLFIGFMGYLAEWNARELYSFNTDLYKYVVVPAMSFQAAFTLRKGGIFRNIITISVMTILLTVVFTVILGLILFALTRAGLDGLDDRYPLESMLLASILSAVDVGNTKAALVTTLKLNDLVDMPLVNDLISGIGVFNGNMALVLYKAFAAYSHKHSVFLYPQIGLAILQFCKHLAVASAIGTSMGGLSALLFKYVNYSSTLYIEPILLYLLTVMSMLLADFFNVSGSWTVLICGLTMGHYTFYNLSLFTQVSCFTFFRILATVARTYVFSYLGLAYFAWGDFVELNWKLMAVSFGLAVVVRAIIVFPICGLMNLFRDQTISFKTMLLLWFTNGRGVFVFTTAADLIKNGKVENKFTIFTTAITSIFFFQVIWSAPTWWVVQKLNLPRQDVEDGDYYRMYPRSSVIDYLKGIDKNYLKPFFIRAKAVGAGEESLSKEQKMTMLNAAGKISKCKRRTFLDFLAVCDKNVKLSRRQDIVIVDEVIDAADAGGD